jgi:PiT family inorganic phosphate transporter
MWQLVSGVFMGWSLGANDAANVFGTAVAARMVRFWTAAILCSIFIVLGAVLEGAGGMETYKSLSATSLNTAFLVGIIAALTMTFFTWLQFPVSSSQAVVGALLAIGVYSGKAEFGVLGKVVACWVGTPIGAMILAYLLYYALGPLINRLNLNLFSYDLTLRTALIVAGCYGSYALGANNVANVTGAFVGPGMLSMQGACLLGGLSIALGVLTFSRGVMMTVGEGVVKLDAYSAFVVVAAQGLTVHVYAMIGVPVSTSQAVVGAVLGIGFVKGVRTINWRMLGNISLAWLATPVVSFLGTYLAVWIGHRFGWL